MNTLNKIFLFLLVVSILSPGCSKDQVTQFPPTGLAAEEFWKTEEEIQSATNAAYLNIDGIDQIAWDGLTEDVFAKEDAILQATTGALGPGATIVDNLWTSSYARIRNANFFFDHVDLSDLPKESLAKYKGQWRFVRAWAYYKLLYSFGDVPLVLKTLEVDEGVVPATPRAEVLKFVMDELNTAFNELSSPDYNPGPGRITKWAVLALQSRLELYEGTLSNDADMLQKSAEHAKNIIESGGFQLHDNYTMLFRPEGENSKEIILSRVYANVASEWNDLIAWLAPISYLSSWNVITPTKALRDKYLDINGKPISQSSVYDPDEPFKNRDGRMVQTIFDYRKDVVYGNGVFKNDGTNYNFRKYIDPNLTDHSRSHTNWILFRLGEVYLNYAEAKNEVSGPSQDIVDYINALRLRGGKGAGPNGTDIIMAPLTPGGLTKESLREIIRRERVVEMVAEGILYYDYSRWRLLESTMNKPAEGVTVLGSRTFQAPRDYLWPIPDFELINNPKLQQNPGWK